MDEMDFQTRRAGKNGYRGAQAKSCDVGGMLQEAIKICDDSLLDDHSGTDSRLFALPDQHMTKCARAVISITTTIYPISSIRHSIR